MSRQVLRVCQFLPGRGQDKRPLILESDREALTSCQKGISVQNGRVVKCEWVKGTGVVFWGECYNGPFTYFLTKTLCANSEV